jgi:hypothetical protein
LRSCKLDEWLHSILLDFIHSLKNIYHSEHSYTQQSRSRYMVHSSETEKRTCICRRYTTQLVEHDNQKSATEISCQQMTAGGGSWRTIDEGHPNSDEQKLLLAWISCMPNWHTLPKGMTYQPWHGLIHAHCCLSTHSWITVTDVRLQFLQHGLRRNWSYHPCECSLCFLTHKPLVLGCLQQKLKQLQKYMLTISCENPGDIE